MVQSEKQKFQGAQIFGVIFCMYLQSIGGIFCCLLAFPSSHSSLDQALAWHLSAILDSRIRLNPFLESRKNENELLFFEVTETHWKH